MIKIWIGEEHHNSQELAEQIKAEILMLDAQIEGLKEWRETRVELLEWLSHEPGYFTDDC